MSDNWLVSGQNVQLVTEDEFSSAMGGTDSQTIFYTALAMLLAAGGGEFRYTMADLTMFKELFGDSTQLGISVKGDQVRVFIYQATLGHA